MSTRLPYHFRLPAIVAALALTLLTGCGGGGDPVAPGDPNPPQATPSFTLAVTALSSIVQGDSATATVTITRAGGFTGAVSLIVEGAPGSVTTQFTNATIAGGSTGSTVTVVVARAVAPGTYPLTVRAEGSGVTTQTATLSLVVTLRPGQLSLVRSPANDQLKSTQGGLPIAFNVLVGQLDATNDVMLEVISGLPAGVTAAFAPAVVASTGVSRVTFTVDNTVQPGSYTAVLRATAATAEPVTLNVPFTILGPAGFEVTIGPSPFTVARNSSGDAQMQVTVSNFDQLYNVAVTGLPGDVTATFERAGTGFPITSYTVRFTVGPAAPLGSFPLVFTASAPGATSGSANMILTVTPAPVGGSTVYRFCGAGSALPIWFGTGRNGASWTRILPDAQGAYAFDIGIKTDVAWVTQNGPNDFDITVMSGSATDLSEFAEWQCQRAASRTVTGTVVGLSASDSALVAVGPYNSTAPITAINTGFSFQTSDGAAHDVLAVRRRPGSGTVATIDRMLIRRGGTMANGAILPLDFVGSESFTPNAITLSVSGTTGGEVANVFAYFHTVGGSRIGLTNTSGGSTANTVATVPQAQQLVGDAHMLAASAQTVSGTDTVTRYVFQQRTNPVSSTVTLGATPGVPQVVEYDGDAVRIRYQAQMLEQTDYMRLFTVTWAQLSGAARRTMRVTATLAGTIKVGNPSMRRIRAPLFDGAPGWSDQWEPRVSAPMRWTVGAFGWDAVGGTAAPRGDGVLTRGYTWTAMLP